MKIKQGEAVKAYKSLTELNRQRLSSGKLAKNIYDLHCKLQQAYDFQVQEEQKVFEAYPEFDPMVGGISLADKTDEEKAEAKASMEKLGTELKELGELDFDLGEYEPFDLDLNMCGDLKISGEDIGNLDQLINFI